MDAKRQSRKDLFDHTLEGYCMVFKKKTNFCELSVVRGKGSEPDILKVNRDSLKNDADWNSNHRFENMNDLLRRLRKDKHGEKKKYYIDYRIIESPYDKEHIYVSVSCQESVIEKWAEERNVDVPIDAKRTIKIAKQQLPEFLLAKRTKLDDDDDNKYTTDNTVEEPLVEWNKWENIHIGYESILHTKGINIFSEPHHVRTLTPVPSAIPHILYLRILYEMLTNDVELDGAGFVTDKFLENKYHPLCQFYALHQTEAKEKMLKDFKTFKCVGCRWDSKGWNTQFLDGIRRYYGEQIAFYFAFLVHYTVWLYPLALIGTIWYIIEEATEEIANGGSVVAVLVIILWSTLMIENWFRREWKLRYRWGMMRYQHTEIPRPAFSGKYIISSVNGMRIETHENTCLHWFKRIISICLSFICVLLVVAVTVIIWSLQNAARRSDEYLSILIGMINSVQIILFNKMFSAFAVFLNDWEGHRLQEQYYNQLVIKRISFIVINSFYSLFYIAFFDKRSEYDDNTVRLKALRTQLIVLFLMAIFYQNSMEICCQLSCSRRCRNCCSKKIERRTKKAKRKVDDESVELITSDDEYQQNHSALTQKNISDIMDQSELYASPDVLDNTAEIIVLHGYVTLFIVVFPLMPLLGVINNYVELLVDKYNLVHTQRPVPFSAGGLGVWGAVLSVFAVVSIYSNLGLLTFRTNVIIDFLIAMEDFFAEIEGVYWTNEDMVENQVTFFFVSTTFFVFVVVGIRMCIPPISSETADDIARQEICQRELLHLNKVLELKQP